MKLASLFTVALLALPAARVEAAARRLSRAPAEARGATVWRVRPSLVLDALCLLNVLTGDPFYVRFYGDEYARFEPRLTPAARASLAALKRKVKDERKNIVSAFLALHFSATDDETLADVLRTLEDPGRMKGRLKKTVYYNDAGWRLFESVRGDLKTAVTFLRDERFEEHWRRDVLPKVMARAAALEGELRPHDVAGEVERHLGVAPPSREVTVYLLNYARPHGIRLTGTRFVADASYTSRVVLQNAVHEMLHPPYDLARDRELRRALDALRGDEFMMSRVRNHDPSFGYNTFESYVEENCVRALDQLVGERLGFSTGARRRWGEEDGGMHVLAAALYGLLKQERFGAGAETFRDFLLRMLRTGRLAPGRVETLYLNALSPTSPPRSAPPSAGKFFLDRRARRSLVSL